MNTPRTDRTATTIKDYAGYDEVVPADVCRDIERELAKMTEDRDYWKAILTASLDQAFETTNTNRIKTTTTQTNQNYES